MGVKIMVIRHAEKPSDDGSVQGVTEAGIQDPDDLVVRGWQRAGALPGLFAARAGASAPLPTPTSIFASDAVKHSKSLRPQHTVAPLAARLSIAVDTQFALGEEVDLAAAALAAGGAVLIAWHHEGIPHLVNCLVGNMDACPQKWPGDRFDLVWIVDQAGDGTWRFSQTPQLLLAGDQSTTA